MARPARPRAGDTEDAMTRPQCPPQRSSRGIVLVGALALSAVASGPAAPADAPDRVPYLDTSLSFEARTRDLVSRLTVEEKISQLMNHAAAIPRLGVPEYEWWNEALHGVARAGVATVFPQAIGLAATFDAPLVHRMAEVISDEARAKHHQFVRQGQRGRYQGLTFWSPNVNIFRDPRWGRGQETYGEDPFLTGRLGVEFVRGLQGDDPRYYKVIATAKHFAVHSGPEPDRHQFDARPSERDLYETYLPAFRALVEDGKAASVMSAYNRVDGESATASRRLLGEILRKEWGFGGYVVSDCGAVDDIYLRHKLVATAEEAATLALSRGCDLECGSSYRALGKALERGLLREADLDVAVARLLLARMKLGLFDPPERVPYAQIPYSKNDAPDHDQLARRVARESIVLLKNDSLLPLRKDLKTIAVVGPTAADLVSLLGNYNGTPSHPVTILAGIRAAAAPSTRVVYARGVELVEGRQDPRAAEAIPAACLRPSPGSNEHGLRGAYFRGREPAGEPVLSRLDPKLDFRWDRGAPTDELVARGELAAGRALPADEFSARWTGVLVPPVTGEYELVVTANDGARLSVDGRRVVDEWTETGVARASSARVQLEAGREHAVVLEYFEAARDAEVRLGWRPPSSGTPFEEALAAARAADVVVFVGGLTAEVEGEEMKVPYPGFAGGDRTDIELPAVQQRMLEALHATGKPVVLVLTTGSALAVRWAQAQLPAIVLAWYPGQQGGSAVADVLFGDTSPAGRLPVTFYKSIDQVPPFADYGMEGRTYRYFRAEPLYPFGHGLSYTRFEYSALRLSRDALGKDDALEVSLDVRNVGGRDGDEVVQLYVRAAAARPPAPLRELRGFERVPLKAGETRRVRFALVPARQIARYDERQKALAVAPGEYEIEIGASSSDLRLRGRVRVLPDRQAAARRGPG
jgi:beta-glucosidase